MDDGRRRMFLRELEHTMIEITKTEPQALGKACPKDAELRRVCRVFYAEEYGGDKCRECWAAWMAAQAGKVGEG